MASSDLVSWATGVGANVLTPAQLVVLQERQQGSQNGFANPLSFNAAMRQASFSAAMIGKFSADYSGLPTYDNGDVQAFEDNFVAALRGATNPFIFGVDNGTTNHIVVTNSIPRVSHYAFGQVYFILITNNNTGASDMNVEGLGIVPIKRSSGSVTQQGDMIAGGFSVFVFDGWQMQLLTNWGGTSGGTVSPTPPTPLSDLTRAGRMPPFGSGRWIYTLSSLIWLCPANVTSIRVRLGAAAGGGQAVSSGIGMGGGGGEWCYNIITVIPGDYYLLSAGVGGVGGLLKPPITNQLSTNGTLSSFGQCTSLGVPIGSALMTANGGLSGDNGGLGGTGGYGETLTPYAGFFGRGTGGNGSALGGAGGGGSQLGNGGHGGQGGGGITTVAVGGPNGGGGSLWGPGDGIGPGTGGLDFLGVAGGNDLVVDGQTPMFPYDFFPGGGGKKNAAVITGLGNSWNTAAGLARITNPGDFPTNVGENGGVGGGGGYGSGVTTNAGEGGDGGVGGGGAGAAAPTNAPSQLGSLAGGGWGGICGGGGGAGGGTPFGALGGNGGPGIGILEW